MERPKRRLLEGLAPGLEIRELRVELFLAGVDLLGGLRAGSFGRFVQHLDLLLQLRAKRGDGLRIDGGITGVDDAAAAHRADGAAAAVRIARNAGDVRADAGAVQRARAEGVGVTAAVLGEEGADRMRRRAMR